MMRYAGWPILWAAAAAGWALAAAPSVNVVSLAALQSKNCIQTSFDDLQRIAQMADDQIVCFDAQVFSNRAQLTLVDPRYDDNKDYTSGIFISASLRDKRSKQGIVGIEKGNRVRVVGELEFNKLCWGIGVPKGQTVVCTPNSRPVRLHDAYVALLDATAP